MRWALFHTNQIMASTSDAESMGTIVASRQGLDLSEEDAMNSFPKHVIYLIAFGAILGIAAFCAETRFPGNTSAASTRDPRAPLATTAETVEETVTLSPADTKTWVYYDEYYSKAPYCGHPFKVGPTWDDVPGSIVAGFKHYYDKGAVIFGCPETLNWNYRGTVWFDLSGIVAKAPFPQVFVKSATLKFKALDSECPSQLGIAIRDWSKGYPANELVPGASFAKMETCGREGCSIDVQAFVNNWVKGAEHTGEANDGFVIMGEREGPSNDNDVCMTRYGEFSLTVTYKYNKTPTILYVPPPEKPVIQVSRPISPEVLALAPVNLALKKSATQISTNPGGEAYRAVDGNTDGVWANGSVAHTNIESQAWWQVDLGSVRAIQNIKVWNREEAPERTSDFYVFVSDEPFKSTDLEATKSQVGPGGSFFTAGSCGRPTELAMKKTGRYVRVQLSGTNYLQLAEVEVFAGPK